MRKSKEAHAHTQELLQELLRAKRGRLSEKLSGDQLALFAGAWSDRAACGSRRGIR